MKAPMTQEAGTMWQHLYANTTDITLVMSMIVKRL